jgi:hypothetical protein
MDRRAAIVSLTLAAAWLGAGSAFAQAQATDETCPLITAAQATIIIDVNAKADRECIRVKKGKTSVVWKGTEAVKSLLIEFKEPDEAKRPKQPGCGGPQCTLDKAKHALKEGEFAYTIVVMRADGTTATVDPKLIIIPAAP